MDLPVGSIRGIRKLEHPLLMANKLIDRISTSHLPKWLLAGQRERRVELWRELIIANQSGCFHTCQKRRTSSILPYVHSSRPKNVAHVFVG